MGEVLPPHLSPFIDKEKDQQYIPPEARALYNENELEQQHKKDEENDGRGSEEEEQEDDGNEEKQEKNETKVETPSKVYFVNIYLCSLIVYILNI